MFITVIGIFSIIITTVLNSVPLAFSAGEMPRSSVMTSSPSSALACPLSAESPLRLKRLSLGQGVAAGPRLVGIGSFVYYS